MTKEQFWSRFSENYDEQLLYVVGRDSIDEIRKTLSNLSLSGNILENGCGTGIFSQTIAKYATHLTACDYSSEMVTRTKQRLINLDNVTILQEDCMNLSFSDSLFDSVILVNLLHIIEDPHKTIEEARRVLKPGGRLIVISFTTNGMSFFNKLAMMYRYLKTYGRPPASSRTLTLSSTKNIIEIDGMKVIDSTLICEKCKAVLVVAEKTAVHKPVL